MVPKHYVTRLAAALRAGPGAERLFDEYGIALYGYCWAMLGEESEAAGALTDTVLVATAHAGALADPGDLTPWVFALARGECLRRRPDAPPAASPYRCDPYADVLTMLVARALTGMRPADRELIDLTVRYRLSAYQLARALDVDEGRAAEIAEIAVTRFDQTLSTLFMGSSGRLAVPREIIADRPPLRVLLDLLPPARPPGALRGNIAAARVDPELDHYRRLVARRVLPLGEDGFPRRPVAPRPAPPPARHGTAAMPLAAPVVTGQDIPRQERTTGGHPVIEPVDAGVIPPEAVHRARTGASAPQPERPEDEERAGNEAPPASPREGRSRPRRTRAQRVRHTAGVILAVLAMVAAIWAAQQIFAPGRSSGPRVEPSATTGGHRGAPVPTGPPTSPGESAHPPASGSFTPPRTRPSPHGKKQTRPHPPGHAHTAPGSPPGPSSPSPSHRPTTHGPTPTGTETPPATEPPSPAE